MSFDVGIASFALATLSLILLLLAQLRLWSTGTSSFVLLVATIVTLIWCLCLSFQTRIPVDLFYLIPAIEILKNLSWFALLLSVLGARKLVIPKMRVGPNQIELAIVTGISIGIPFVIFFYLLYVRLVQGTIIFFPGYGGQILLIGFLLSAIVGMALLEQVIRNTRQHHVWHLKFLCLGLGILFSYDIYLYSNAILFGRIQDSLWEARGSVIFLATPLIAIGVLRTREHPIQVNISRRLVFHSGVLVAAGLYLLLMASAGYYLRNFSDALGPMIQALFIVVALSVLVVLVYSGRMRSILKMYISRHLFSSKYDYRDEWMRISNTLSQSSSGESLPDRAIKAIAETVDSPAGGLWLTKNNFHYDQVAQIEMGWIEGSELTDRDELIQFLKSENRVIELNEGDGDLNQLVLPVWLASIKKAWLIVPLWLHDSLLGFILLKESRVDFDMNWEDFDLLKAAGQQAASYLAQMIASDALAEARQFSAFNQVSAFVVHDIKTLNSQLSLMVRNSEKHKTNPSFIEDMIKTTNHAVNKMTLLLKHFRSEEQFAVDGEETLDLVTLIPQIIAAHGKLQPLPTFSCSEEQVLVVANESEIRSAIGHLIQNAQEATDDKGQIVVSLSVKDGIAKIQIRDTGSGMTQEFIKTRLFRPFESTKGLTGMGIGVFQSRESIRKLGGDLKVYSKPGVGTEFVITLLQSKN